MEANDLNKSSEEKMDLNSGKKPETTGNETMNQEPKNVPNVQDPDPELSEKKEQDTVLPKEPSSHTEKNVIEEEAANQPPKKEAPEDAGPASENEITGEEEKPSIQHEEAPSEPGAESKTPEASEKPSVEEQTPEPVKTQEEALPENKEDISATPVDTPSSDATDKPETAAETSTEKNKSADQPGAKTQASSPAKDIVRPEDVDYSVFSREKLVKQFTDYLKNQPLSLIKGHLEAIRSTFEGKTAREQLALKKEFLKSGEPEENFSPLPDELEITFKDLLHEFRKKREEERNRKEEEKAKNLKAKYEVIESIKDLINRQESLDATFQEFRDLQQKWRDIGPVPQKEMHDMWENYHLHVENFYNYIKINKELRDLDLKKNYEKKLELCELAEKLLLEPTIIKAFKTLQKYHDQWRETGPVVREKKDELWARFKDATAKINKKHQEHFENIKEQFEKNLQDKRELCEKAEAFLQNEYHNAREWEKSSKALIELQQVWKTIGFAPKKENTEIYHRFRKACDDFFSQKRDFFKQYKESQIHNLELKTELCQQAENLKDSEDWKTTTNEFIRIQKKWKEIGPVPRRSSDAIWKRFREACDFFFNKKSNFFSKKDETQEENLKLKEQLIEELKEYKPGTDNDENFKNIQTFQNRWSQIGFVPFKEKDRLNREFRQLINAQFDQLNMDESRKSIQKYRSKVESWKGEEKFSDHVIQERNKTIGKLKSIENDISIWENNIGFFAKSKNSDALIRDFTNKIKAGKRNIETLNKKLDLLDEMLNKK